MNYIHKDIYVCAGGALTFHETFYCQGHKDRLKNSDYFDNDIIKILHDFAPF